MGPTHVLYDSLSHYKYPCCERQKGLDKVNSQNWTNGQVFWKRGVILDLKSFQLPQFPSLELEAKQKKTTHIRRRQRELSWRIQSIDILSSPPDALRNLSHFASSLLYTQKHCTLYSFFCSALPPLSLPIISLLCSSLCDDADIQPPECSLITVSCHTVISLLYIYTLRLL